MNSEQFELFTTLFLLNLAKQQQTLTTGLISADRDCEEKENVDQVNNNNNINFPFSGPQLEPPTPPRTPIISASTSNGDVRTPTKSAHASKIKPTITLTPTSKLLADQHRRGSVSDLSETEETSKNIKQKQQFSDLDDNFSDRESNKAYDFSRFNDDSNMSDAGNNSDQDSDMGLTIDSNNSFESRLSLPNTRKLMDNKSQTPLVRIDEFFYYHTQTQ